MYCMSLSHPCHFCHCRALTPTQAIMVIPPGRPRLEVLMAEGGAAALQCLPYVLQSFPAPPAQRAARCRPVPVFKDLGDLLDAFDDMPPTGGK